MRYVGTAALPTTSKRDLRRQIANSASTANITTILTTWAADSAANIELLRRADSSVGQNYCVCTNSRRETTPLRHCQAGNPARAQPASYRQTSCTGPCERLPEVYEVPDQRLRRPDFPRCPQRARTPGAIECGVPD